MNVKALMITVGAQRIGVLFQYAMANADVINRFVADDEFAALLDAPVVSAAFLAPLPEQARALWADVRSAQFNGRHSSRNGWLLPAFFQNLLPEGVFRDHVAALRGCDPQDHFEMLAACGRDLPGNVQAVPAELSRHELARYVTQHNDALEMSVTAEPLEEGVSLSGVQPKLGVIREGDRYVGRTKDHDTHIIAKLPVVDQPRLPEVEELSLRLAAAAGVQVCTAELAPLSRLAVMHGYDLGDMDEATQFLAVVRFDRAPTGRIHCEDFAQVLNVMPEDKYQAASYLNIAAAMMTLPSLGERAVHELLRRMAVNELLGNPDMHLKNIGLRYPDGRTPELSPAYDIVAYAAFGKRAGHALHILPPAMRAARPAAASPEKPRLSPSVVREFCADLGIAEKPAAAA
ncbi:MAG: type II toxin-antitoxin system HipA family toxin, partial [Pseudomonadota bacterium]